jgi:hypothetical protein
MLALLEAAKFKRNVNILEERKDKKNLHVPRNQDWSGLWINFS